MIALGERFWSKVEKTEGCWNVIDHLCRNPACVNPSHMEPVSRGENVLRGEAPSAIHARGERCGRCASCRNAAKSECKRGHPLSGSNLYVARSGMRVCRKCAALRARNRKMLVVA